ncbi:hypothetical protein BO71DRAFT_29267 [Aspergillus ellipticus CBS 707.79]|uniref:Uncharacterized protein n=1 Tax=Aspergillus ellipticus CBS 707.79 TaxID=1448320 RepID=A0A319D526_9EURO|nr:hypothetical protein BO71DRAFT_29267 [Aspergillus ellipticus CBS 707.79]
MRFTLPFQVQLPDTSLCCFPPSTQCVFPPVLPPTFLYPNNPCALTPCQCKLPRHATAPGSRNKLPLYHVTARRSLNTHRSPCEPYRDAVYILLSPRSVLLRDSTIRPPASPFQLYRLFLTLHSFSFA